MLTVGTVPLEITEHDIYNDTIPKKTSLLYLIVF